LNESKSTIFGPVPSRRLGLSLGVDLVPHKVCTLDCIYCQVGHTTRKSLERSSFVDLDRIKHELAARLQQGPRPDYITLSGSGEPTLNCDLEAIIRVVRGITEIPIALITNGTLLHLAQVRSECLGADVILPSLDASDEALFRKINRPHEGLTVADHVAGLEALRREYRGQIWLEVFLVQDLNTSDSHRSALRSHIRRIRPDRIHLNTAVRPTADSHVQAVPAATLHAWAVEFGPKCEVIADFQHVKTDSSLTGGEDTTLTLLQRRPCSNQDVATGLGIELNQADIILGRLVNKGKIYTETKSGLTYYRVTDPFPS
jgi:wyosine [tRNA(Phe)-imidazoG37] synthetase (radical SAM superfamily)